MKVLTLKLIHTFSEFYQENSEESLAYGLIHMNLLFVLGAIRVRCFNSSVRSFFNSSLLYLPFPRAYHALI